MSNARTFVIKAVNLKCSYLFSGYFNFFEGRTHISKETIANKPAQNSRTNLIKNKNPNVQKHVFLQRLMEANIFEKTVHKF